MHEFETFAYLDVQKTGSTFISYILTECSNEKLVRFDKHHAVDDTYDRNKFYFISVREPMDQYISLYSHGCSGGGGLSKRFRNKGHGDLYDSTWKGFRKWMKFILTPEGARLLDKQFGSDEQISQLIGFQTWRFLELAMRDPLETLQACKTRDDLRAAYKEKAIPRYSIRHENFVEDLVTLVTGDLRYAIRDPDEAVRLIREGDKVNASDRVDAFEPDPSMGAKIVDFVEDREWLLRELYGY